VSIPVDLTALQDQIARFGPSALLVTTSGNGPPHIASVLVAFERGGLTMGVGRRTRANIAARPAVSLVWSEGAGSDYCLIVDGAAQETPTTESEQLVVRPTSAVLHRLAHASADIPSCLPVEEVIPPRP
jgi:hypothetical protein